MYIESDAWVTNLKQKLACGSILISNKMEYYEFFTRALQPGLHYVQVDPGDLCNDTAFKVRSCPSPLAMLAVSLHCRSDCSPWPCFLSKARAHRAQPMPAHHQVQKMLLPARAASKM